MSKSKAPLDSEHATVSYDESLDAVRIDWKRSASGSNFRAVLNQGLAQVRKHDATHWVADLREMGTVAPDDQEWTANQWFPEAQSTSLTRMAVVQSERLVQQMSVDNIMNEVGDDLKHHYFDNMAEAEEWLDE